MKLSVCAIVKNEVNRIQNFVEEVSSFADEIIIVDNGSNDGTWDKLEILNCISLQCSSEFDLARNAYIERASGDWILTLDIDERLDPLYIHHLRWSLERMDDDVNGVILPLFSYFGEGGWCQWTLTRVLRNNKISKLESPIHASFNDAALKNGGRLKFVYAPIHHYDALWNIDQTEKRIRNAKLLSKNIENDASLYKNLADETCALGNASEAINIGITGLTKDTKPNSRICKGLANYCYANGQYEDAIYYAAEQINRFAPQVEKNDARAERYRMEIEACRVIQYKSIYMLGRIDEALSICDENIKQYPFLPHNYLNRYFMTEKRSINDLIMTTVLNPELIRNPAVFQPVSVGSLYEFAASTLHIEYRKELNEIK
ncbi:MAG: glycosyltransferase [Lachnospiraceae bacterium]|nr:glycosyltransferase [Lachnospiraceae bacterium]